MAAPATGLVSDYDVANVAGPPADGDPVATFPDSVGAHDATAAGAAQPLYRIAGPNSFPYLQFDGTAMYIKSAAVTAVAQPYRVFIVFRSSLWQTGGRVFDGQAANRCLMDQLPLDFNVGGLHRGIQQYSMFSGTAFVCTNTGGGMSQEGQQWGFANCLFNGASSSLSMNGNTPIVANPGANTYTGISFGGAGNGTNFAKCDIVRCLVYNSSIVSSSAVESYLISTYALVVPNLLLTDGDSYTSGNGASDYLTSQIVFGSYPTQARALLGSTWALINAGKSGQTVVQMEADATTNIDTNLNTLSPKKILVAWGGSNDLAIGGSSAATCYADYVTYCTNRVNAGWRVISVTILPRSPTGISATFEADRQTVNTSIRAGWQTFSHVLADIAADPRVGDAGDQNDPTYYNADKIHLNDTGNGIMAALVNSDIVAQPLTSNALLLGVGRF